MTLLSAVAPVVLPTLEAFGISILAKRLPKYRWLNALDQYVNDADFWDKLWKRRALFLSTIFPNNKDELEMIYTAMSPIERKKFIHNMIGESELKQKKEYAKKKLNIDLQTISYLRELEEDGHYSKSWNFFRENMNNILTNGIPKKQTKWICANCNSTTIGTDINNFFDCNSCSMKPIRDESITDNDTTIAEPISNLQSLRIINPDTFSASENNKQGLLSPDDVTVTPRGGYAKRTKSRKQKKKFKRKTTHKKNKSTTKTKKKQKQRSASSITLD